MGDVLAELRGLLVEALHDGVELVRRLVELVRGVAKRLGLGAAVDGDGVEGGVTELELDLPADLRLVLRVGVGDLRLALDRVLDGLVGLEGRDGQEGRQDRHDQRGLAREGHLPAAGMARLEPLECIVRLQTRRESYGGGRMDRAAATPGPSATLPGTGR